MCCWLLVFIVQFCVCTTNSLDRCLHLIWGCYFTNAARLVQCLHSIVLVRVIGKDFCINLIEANFWTTLCLYKLSQSVGLTEITGDIPTREHSMSICLMLLLAVIRIAWLTKGWKWLWLCSFSILHYYLNFSVDSSSRCYLVLSRNGWWFSSIPK